MVPIISIALAIKFSIVTRNFVVKADDVHYIDCINSRRVVFRQRFKPVIKLFNDIPVMNPNIMFIIFISIIVCSPVWLLKIEFFLDKQPILFYFYDYYFGGCIIDYYFYLFSIVLSFLFVPFRCPPYHIRGNLIHLMNFISSSPYED